MNQILLTKQFINISVSYTHLVDYAIIETGLGGTFDATNCISRPDKVCVITKIGFDHMKIPVSYTHLDVYKRQFSHRSKRQKLDQKNL